jgi:hypothetical protein
MAATLTIGGNAYTMIEDTFDLTLSLDERQRFQCDVIDYTGSAHFVKGQSVSISDPVLGTIFTGVLNSDKEVPMYPSGTILHSIDCIDKGHYIADKRTYSAVYDTATYAGKIVVDQIDSILSAEGITQNYGINTDTTDIEFNNSLNASTRGRLNIGDGNLELTPAGTDFSLVEDTTTEFSSGTLTSMQATANTLVPTTVNALKMQSTLSFAYGIEFAQAQQSVSGTVNSSLSGSASVSGSGNFTGSASGSISVSGSGSPSGSVSISGGQSGESLSGSFFGNSMSVNSSGSANLSASTSGTINSSGSISGSASGNYSSSVTPVYQPKFKSRVKIDETHFAVVSVDKAVADNRIDAVIWTGSQVIGSNDVLNYDIWTPSTSPSEEGGIELNFSDGTSLTQYLGSLQTNTDVGIWDQNLLSASPIQDLSDHSKDCWYNRQINLSILSGKTVTSVSMFTAGNVAGTFTTYIKNCYLNSHSGSPFFSTGQSAPSVNPPTLSSVGAYVTSATLMTVVQVYDPAVSARISPAYNIDPVKLVKSSLISWAAVNPVLGPSVVPGAPGNANNPGSEAIFVSYDGTTWLPCTSGQALPGLPAGSNVSGLSLYLLETFNGGQDPSAIPTILNVSVNIYSAPTASTTDIVNAFGSAASWNTGTETGTAPNSSGDLILGKTSYTWSNLNNMTFVPGGTVTPTQSVVSNAYTITSPGSGGPCWSSTRFNFISAAQDFTAEADFILSNTSPTQNEIGFIYRQTYWGSPNNSFAYYIRIMQNPSGSAGGTSVTLGYGLNSPPTGSLGGGPSSGPFTSVIISSQTITNGTTYHVKLVVSQNRHTVYWNNGSNPIIDILDNTYTQAGNIGIRTYLVSSNTATNKILNFTVTNTFAGLWKSPSISLNSLGTCGNTQICWSELNTKGNVQATAIVNASLDGGSTWTQCANGALSSSSYIPGLPPGTNVTGKSLIIQIILSSTGFLVAPEIWGLYIRVCGAYPGCSGTRSTAPLGLDVVTRANQSLWGTAYDGQSWVKVGTCTDAINNKELTITNTTGDVHEVLGSRTWTDEDGTVRFSLSAATISAGIELRYSNVNNLYRFSTTTTIATLTKVSSGFTTILGTTPVTLTTGTYYRMRFRVTGSSPGNIRLYGEIWPDLTLEPLVTNANAWTLTGSE